MFAVIYGSFMRVDFLRASYVEFPYPTAEALNQAITSGRAQLATVSNSIIADWILNASKQPAWIELRASLQQHPLIGLNINDDVCDYRNNSDITSSQFQNKLLLM